MASLLDPLTHSPTVASFVRVVGVARDGERDTSHDAYAQGSAELRYRIEHRPCQCMGPFRKDICNDEV